ncbi:isoleucine--tRNA ligase [Parvularcula sp. IMCC14364]|uniref:isoleucine--tRNA ligase n=1 Tax=Parvularcula sp. IMCC14364 TaxID=3067902 RepID=UPI002740FE80|nr:isoleucine--tRNA ligase [Parvularcula sp. IMCC14364]
MPDSNDAPDTGRDYKDTLFLPNTGFPMRAGLPKAEPKLLQRWADMGLYRQLREDARGRTPFVLHDGPPYANGNIHMGTGLTKILKDMIVRSRQMDGFDANYVPGWDCHGLPIEWKVEEEFRARGRNKRDVPAVEFRAQCRTYAQKWLDIQCDEFRRLGGEGDWENPYTTMAFTSEAVIARELLKFVDAGLLYRGSKPVMWSPVEQTALAEAEIEYHDHQSTTIWVKFPFADGKAPAGLENASIVIWTTTPWTIPGNRAICYGPRMSYGVYEVLEMQGDLDFEPWSKPGDQLIVADALAESVRSAGLIAEWKRLDDVPPESLATALCHHPLRGHAEGYMFDIPLLSGDHVTDEAGTGFVHTAPSHGAEDFDAWMAHGLSMTDIPHTVNEMGAYTSEAPGFEGRQVIVTEGKKKGKDGDANKAVIDALLEHGALLARGRLKHSYPHSWRSRAPVIFRNTPQWFIALGKKMADGTSLREKALKGIDDTGFTPAQARNRIRSMVEGRPDWLISRQRAWGVPITIFVNRETGDILNDPAVNQRVLSAIQERGADAWFDTPMEDFLGPDHPVDDYEKVEDILDVWFDSGSTHAFVLEDREDLTWPADVYCEGSDQHRGWFQSSLLQSCGTRGRPPYKHIITNGFVVDSDGRKMSKSLGNVILPETIIKQYGAEIIRIWAASIDYTEDPRVGDEIIGSAVDAYRKLRNTLRYLLGAVSGYSEAETVDVQEMPELEQYVLHLLAGVDADVHKSYAAFDFKAVWRRVSDFCSLDLSSFYLDIRKDSLYCDSPDDMTRRAARTVMNTLLDHIMRWLAPICPFTTEEVFLHRYPDQEHTSVHLLQFADVPSEWNNAALAGKWGKIRTVRKVVTGALEVERREKRIGASLEAAPVIHIEDDVLRALCQDVDWAELSITSAATLTDGTGPAEAFRLDETAGVSVLPTKADGGKCQRCWRILEEVTAEASICGRCDEAVTALEQKTDG